MIESTAPSLPLITQISPAMVTDSTSLILDPTIRINQIGYQPNQVKMVIIADNSPANSTFQITNEQNLVVAEGTLVPYGIDPDSQENLVQGNFTNFVTNGIYRIYVKGRGISYPFKIAPDANLEVLHLAARWFYLQRSGRELNDPVTGFHHLADHTSPAILWDKNGIHQDQTFDVSGGWWDAGDFGRYTSPAATTLMSLFYAYRFNPKAFIDGSLNIPESGNGTPDLLDEARWELEWMLKMQRPDGAVHHKATTAHFASTSVPGEDTQQIYIFDVSTHATGQFAGVMAEASLVYRSIDPEFADRLLDAARKAEVWLEVNPDSYPKDGFHNPKGCDTGEYGNVANDLRFRLWAVSSLFHATGEPAYAEKFSEFWPKRETWPVVYTLYWPDGYAYAMFAYLDSPGADEGIKTQIEGIIAEQSQTILKVINSTGYHVALRGNKGDFGYNWGSNTIALSAATYLLLTNQVMDDPKLVDGAASQLNWILGVNPLNKAYITGAGSNPIQTLHHSLSAAMGFPAPGAIGEGPNAIDVGGDPVLQRLFDDKIPFSKRYADSPESWATNEPTIYGNAAFLAVAAWFTR